MTASSTETTDTGKQPEKIAPAGANEFDRKVRRYVRRTLLAKKRGKAAFFDGIYGVG